MTAGGARAGAGRPVTGRKVRRWVDLDAATDKQIRDHARVAGVPMSAMLRAIVEIAVVNATSAKPTKAGKPPCKP